MEREVMKKSKQNFILICMYKKIYEPFFNFFFFLSTTIILFIRGTLNKWGKKDMQAFLSEFL
jgi:hypothetical protein